MDTKGKLLALLEEKKGEFISGEAIAGKLSISRTAVWKAVKSLRADGYRIEAVQNRGYSLDINSDILSVQGIEKYLGKDCRNLKLNVYQCVTSTNALLRDLANSGAEEGYVIVSSEQTMGRGRLGRKFYSPSDTGVYMSILLRPRNISPEKATGITTMAAVAACEAIEKTSGISAGIKWVNDIYIEGKKVSGILSEAVLDLENGCLDYVVLGIGINVYPPEGGFPEDIKNIAGAVFSQHQRDGKNRLAAEFLNSFMDIYYNDTSDYSDRYRSRSLAIGREIKIISSADDNVKFAKAIDVDSECRLVVQYPDGRIDKLSSGEISIRFL